MDRLAILGGPKAVPDGMIRNWPPISALDRRYVLASLEGDNHAYGPNCRKFEEEFARWNGNKYAVNTNSGTAALHMAVAACGLSAGDHVLVTAYSWSSSATAILHANCIPVFVDIDFDTMNMDVSKIEAAITPRTKAIVAVHLHGLALDMDKVLAVAKRHNLKVIEDACQSHGATFKGRKVGKWGDCAAFSFNQNKSLSAGEGGMFTTDDKALRDAAVQLWNFGETRTPAQSRDYHAYALGWMYRSSDLSAAFARAQLTRLDRYIDAQRKHAAILLEDLAGLPGLILPCEPRGFRHSYYNFTCRIDMEAIGWKGDPVRMRDAVIKALNSEGAPVGIWQHFPLPAMTVFLAKNAYGRGCPWSCRYTKAVKYNPADFPLARKHCDTHFGMTHPIRLPNGVPAVKAVAKAFRKVFENVGALDVERILREGK